ncbi:MAG: hypothetical protein JKY93_10135 [Gammaproteobacteria bacterium]|nr:hypothetical protein [Gammaproteobacteria bacterium]
MIKCIRRLTLELWGDGASLGVASLCYALVRSEYLFAVAASAFTANSIEFEDSTAIQVLNGVEQSRAEGNAKHGLVGSWLYVA